MNSEDRAEFLRFAASHRLQAVSLATRLCGGDRAAGEDVAQESFLRAYGALATFRGGPLRPWFRRILVNQAANHRRGAALRRPAREAVDVASHAPAGDPAARRELRNRLSHAVQRLPEGQRQAFELVHVQGFTVPEAAGALDKADGTIKSHLHRAVHRLRRELADLRPGLTAALLLLIVAAGALSADLPGDAWVGDVLAAEAEVGREDLSLEGWLPAELDPLAELLDFEEE